MDVNIVNNGNNNFNEFSTVCSLTPPTTISTSTTEMLPDMDNLHNILCIDCHEMSDDCICNKGDERIIQLKNLLNSWNLSILLNHFISKFI